MAKGLRNKQKRRFRAIKREKIFAPVAEARLLRLAAHQASIETSGLKINSENNIPQQLAVSLSHPSSASETKFGESKIQMITSSSLTSITSQNEVKMRDLKKK